MNNKLLLLFAINTFFLSSCLFTQRSPVNADTVSEEKPGDITVYVTTANRSLDFAKSSINFSNKPLQDAATITLDPSIRYQEMDGFGAAITGSSCYNLLKMSEPDRTKFLTETFSHETGMGYSYIRISIGCSDFSLSEYTCCDTKGIENFALQEEELKYVIPVLKEILKINPTVKILGSPWTIPQWMKVNNLSDMQPHNSWTSGHLNPAYYEDYAIYFVKWIQAFAEYGIQVGAITPQNEPLNRGNSASLFMGWDEQRDFVKVLGPKLRKAGLKTKIYVFDHNYNYDNMKDQFSYPVKIYEDAEAKNYITGAAYHNYGGNRKELLSIHDQAPGMELIFTETSIGTWNNGQDLSERLMSDMEEVALGTVNNWCKAVIVWNLMLDTNRGPNREHGCQTCYGAVDIDAGDYKTIVRNSHYYIIGHLSAVVKPGAFRIKSSGNVPEGIGYTAFENPDGSYAVVLQNNSDENKSITLSDGNNHFDYQVTSKSVASFHWQK